MEFVRYQASNEIKYGVAKDHSILEIKGDIFGKYKVTSIEHSRDTLDILPPVTPTKIVCVGLNYLDHAQELDMPVPEEPLLFLKPPSSVIGPDETILLPASSTRIDFEAELAIIIGTTARKVSIDKAADYIMGYTCANDVTARDFQKKDGQWTRAKSFDTFSPIGPGIVTDLDVHALNIQCLVNGTVVQSSNTRKMIFKPAELVSYISHVMTLFPGDVIITGTPPGVNELKEEDIVEVKIDKIGTLRNYVQKE